MEVFNLNIRPGKTCPVIHCSQFDKGRAFRANLYDGSEVYTLTGAETLSVIEKKSDGNMVTIGVANTSDSYVVFATTEQMTAVAGAQMCELRIEEGDDLIGSLNFLLDCEASPDTGIESDSAIHNLETQIADINAEVVPPMVAEEVANQYDSQNVIFDDHPTAGHGTGYVVKSENVPAELNDLDDVAISGQAQGEALVWDSVNNKWVNGTVSTVGGLNDLNDVTIDDTSLEQGQELVYNGTEEVFENKTTRVELTQAEYNQLVADDEVLPDVDYYITDAPSMQGTSADLSYDGGTDSTYDVIEEVKDDVEDLDANKANASDLPTASLVSFDASKWNSKTSNREIRITKYGKVVSMYIVFTLTSALSANESIISNGGVPPIGLNQNEYQFPITCVSGTNAGKSARVRISKDGGISDWYSQNTFFASSCTFLMSATYITN